MAVTEAMGATVAMGSGKIALLFLILMVGCTQDIAIEEPEPQVQIVQEEKIVKELNMPDCMASERTRKCLAIYQMNISHCEFIPLSEEKRNNCRDGFYLYSALENSQDECDLIVDQNRRETCLALTDLEGMDCQGFVMEYNNYTSDSNTGRLICEAIKAKDRSNCDSMAGQDKVQCLDKVLYARIMLDKDLSVVDDWIKNFEFVETRENNEILAYLYSNVSYCTRSCK